MATTVPEGYKSWKEYSQQSKALKRQRNEEKIMKHMKRARDQAEKVEQEARQAEEEAKNANFSTISIAVPGSIMENAQSPELRSYLAGQIARAASIFSVDEIIVYDDIGDKMDVKKSKIDDMEGTKVARKSCVQLAKILQYLECPQYLRKFFFPLHEDLKFAGILNPLDAPHHLRVKNNFHFREGIITTKPIRANGGSIVNVGLLQDVTVDKVLNPGLRVTVRMLPPTVEKSKKLRGKIESLTAPRAETGVYWGYVVRMANNLSEVFSKSPYKNGYDITIGTSDNGTHLDEIPDGKIKYHHGLILFGGLQGIEAALENDDNLTADDPSLLFDHYINTVPTQGSRTIRTEEAILITMSALRNKIKQKHKVKTFLMPESIAQSCEVPLTNRFETKIKMENENTNNGDGDAEIENNINRFD